MAAGLVLFLSTLTLLIHPGISDLRVFYLSLETHAGLQRKLENGIESLSHLYDDNSDGVLSPY